MFFIYLSTVHRVFYEYYLESFIGFTKSVFLYRVYSCVCVCKRARACYYRILYPMYKRNNIFSHTLYILTTPKDWTVYGKVNHLSVIKLFSFFCFSVFLSHLNLITEWSKQLELANMNVCW